MRIKCTQWGLNVHIVYPMQWGLNVHTLCTKWGLNVHNVNTMGIKLEKIGINWVSPLLHNEDSIRKTENELGVSMWNGNSLRKNMNMENKERYWVFLWETKIAWGKIWI